MASEHAIPVQQPRECEIAAAATVVNAFALRSVLEDGERTTYEAALDLLSNVFAKVAVK